MCVGKTNAFQMVNLDCLRVVEKGRIITHYNIYFIDFHIVLFLAVTMDRFLYFKK